MEKMRVALGAIVLAIMAISIFALYQVACYEVRACVGDRQLYLTYATLALIALYALALVHVFVTKLQSRKM